MTTKRTMLVLGAMLSAACAKGDTKADSTAVDSSHAMAGMGADTNKTTAGGGVPAGYVGRTDDGDIASVHYAAAGNAWDVQTGPAHILYRASDSASGVYTAKARIEQLEAPTHPEAYGVIVGGQNLDQPSEKYTYFLVRGTGDYAVKVRDGTSARDVIKWTASPNVPKADASGRSSYDITVKAAADSLHFMVNDKPVAAVPRASLPADGVAGVRVNHNLKVRVTPVAVTK